ncbi:MAG: DUF1501 domain-containing protein [Saprospiraceae bacterium]|nr:DUF1501 domain-containing protein [Saprospiraceae bacterium]
MKETNINRRDFIKTAALASIPLTLGGFPLYALPNPLATLLDGDNDRILVLVQLQGGNDGLATIFHAGQYDNLQAVRGNIILPESAIINFHNDYGFHSGMQGLKDVWQMGNLGIVQNVGYPNQNRSHFRSTDIWNSASSAEEFDSTGWIGRFYDLNHAGYPAGYPNSECPHPFALTMGKIVSETCQGMNANYSLALLDPFNPGTALVSSGNDIPENCFGDALSFVNDTVSQTNAFASVIGAAANAGNNLSAKWNTLETELARKLKNIARLISGGLQTKIYVVQIGGFDTHDNQVVDGATTTGIHSDLLRELSDAICAFQDDLNLLNVSKKVIGMTYSEFGRRIRSNAALGTDHGTAAPLFLFGACIENQILGDHPEIDTQVGNDEGVPMQYDFRDIYGTFLKDWLGLKDSEVAGVIHSDVQILPLFKPGCIETSATNQAYQENEFQINLSPNPASSMLNIEFSAPAGQTIITVFDGMGGVINALKVESNSSRIQNVNLNVSNYPPGSYFIHLGNRVVTKTKKFVKL